jgi:hypothetical protein
LGRDGRNLEDWWFWRGRLGRRRKDKWLELAGMGYVMVFTFVPAPEARGALASGVSRLTASERLLGGSNTLYTSSKRLPLPGVKMERGMDGGRIPEGEERLPEILDVDEATCEIDCKESDGA